jgi:hypothetical protein
MNRNEIRPKLGLAKSQPLAHVNRQSTMNAPHANECAEENALLKTPIILDLGKISKKKVKQLKEGKGVYATQVQPAIAAVAAQLGERAQGKELVPVVVVYRQKPKKSKLPLLNLLP